MPGGREEVEKPIAVTDYDKCTWEELTWPTNSSPTMALLIAQLNGGGGLSFTSLTWLWLSYVLYTMQTTTADNGLHIRNL